MGLSPQDNMDENGNNGRANIASNDQHSFAGLQGVTANGMIAKLGTLIVSGVQGPQELVEQAAIEALREIAEEAQMNGGTIGDSEYDFYSAFQKNLDAETGLNVDPDEANVFILGANFEMAYQEEMNPKPKPEMLAQRERENDLNQVEPSSGYDVTQSAFRPSPIGGSF